MTLKELLKYVSYFIKRYKERTQKVIATNKINIFFTNTRNRDGPVLLNSVDKVVPITDLSKRVPVYINIHI